MAGRDGRIGLLAGSGTFPEVIAEAVKASGEELVCIQVVGQSEVLPAVADHYRRCDPGAVTEVIAILRQQRVREVLVAGRFSRANLFASGDSVHAALMNATDRRDIPLLERFAALLAEMGIAIVDQARFVRDLLVPPGVLTERAPTADEAADIAFGRTVARAIAELDVGQTVVVRRGVILAVEAAEGTDATIRRGGAMVPESIVVKVSRSNQDPRFDIPAVGLETIRAMRDVGARALAIDGRRTLLLQRDRVIAEAEAGGIAIEAADTPPLGTPIDARR